MKFFCTFLLALPAVLPSEAFHQEIKTEGAGTVIVECQYPGQWKIKTELSRAADGLEFLAVKAVSEVETDGPKLTVRFEPDQKDANFMWTTGHCTDARSIKPSWSGQLTSHIASQMPLVSFSSESQRNRLTVSSDECFRLVRTRLGAQEYGSKLFCEMQYFRTPEAPLKEYNTVIRIDSRDVFWAEAVRDGADWMSRDFKLCKVPEAAFEPLYSTWYQFHRGVSASEVEAECREASALGMKTVILDDGWQIEGECKNYDKCGDWKVNSRTFPDMRAHVDAVHRMGMKYMVWFSVPFIGEKAENLAVFKGKYLYSEPGKSILDPRFPEVREFLASLYEQSMKDWGIDGFKLDFIDQFVIRDNDPAASQNYAGRDYKSVEDAVDVLMKDITRRLQALCPEVLIEFRQNYIGPAIRQYGNMLRAGDCPSDPQTNRVRISDLRLTSGPMAVHADMLEWNGAETPQTVARNIQSALFGVIQYSVMLRDIPGPHKDVVTFWLNFSQRHREALLKGVFKPFYPQANYPLLVGESGSERIAAVYNEKFCYESSDTLPTTLVNATPSDCIVCDFMVRPRSVSLYDCYGRSAGTFRVPRSGLVRIPVPASGFAEIFYQGAF